jgi:parallel beta-helix repeat protein
MKIKISLLALAFLFVPSFSFASILISGTLPENTTWTTGNTYVVSGLTIPAGVTLTIPEGTVVKFSDIRTVLEVNGNLIVNGTQTNPSYFTSINDSTVGESLGTGIPLHDDWGNITINEGGTAEFNHSVIRYGGYTGWLTSTTPSSFRNHGGNLTITNSIISHSWSGVIHESGTTILTGNTFSENNAGISSSGTGNLTFNHNTFSSNTGNVASFDLSSGLAFTHSDNTVSGGTQAGIILGGTTASDYFFEKDAVPYIIDHLTIPEGRIVTANKGSVFKFLGITSDFFISGKLNIEGTASEPVYFTSIKDDSILGDTNGEASEPTINEWEGIFVLTDGEANFDHSIVRYGGYTGWLQSTMASNISNDGGILNISNSEISNSTFGVHHFSGTTSVATSTISENSTGIYAGGTGTLSVTGNTFSNNVSPAYFDISGFVLTNANNTAIGTGSRGFDTGGTLGVDQTLGKDTMPYLVSGLSIPSGRTLSVAPGAVIKMASIRAQISVAGTLNAIGTKENPIYFTSINDNSVGGTTGTGDPQPADWAEMGISTGGAMNFNHAVIRYGGYNGWLVWTDLSNLANRGGTLNIQNSEISHAYVGIVHTAGTTNISQSSIHDNAGYGINNVTTVILNARNNYWGSPAGPYHPILNVGGIANNKVSDYVDFIPWLLMDPTEEIILPPTITLTNATETEDDDLLPDGKGVADKTNFTFDVLYTGATAPNDVTLWTNANGTTKSYALAISATTTNDEIFTNGEWYTFTGTFPQGDYGYHFEANEGVARFPAMGELSFTAGYSNVAFIPGLEASRLFRTNTSPANQIWDPPKVWHDNSQLFLDKNGISNNSDIVTFDGSLEQGVIDESWTQNVYKTFIEYMNNEVVGKGLINEWEALPYDWRLNFPEIIDNGNKTGEYVSYLQSTSSPFIVQELRRLASTSDTGKVTIITHSNGGLLVKYLLASSTPVNNKNHDILSKIDTVIMVAAPQVGTPKAIAGLLHGDAANLGGGIVLTKTSARALGENMQSAYNLIPSSSYFGTVQTSVLVFDKNVNRIPELNLLSEKSITTANGLNIFLRGQGGLWNDPSGNDLDTPNVLEDGLLTKAKNIHDIIDGWNPPANIQVVQIAGWGLDTIKEIHYSCPFLTCSSLSTLDRSIGSTTLDGDETVVVPSAVYMSTTLPNVERWWVDIDKQNRMGTFNERRNRDHSSIFEVDELQSFIKSIISGRRVTDNNAVVVNTKPIVTDETKRLRFTLHSPVDIHLYDSFGNHTGLLQDNDRSSDILLFEKNIPNSYYREFGETKSAGVSEGNITTVKLIGTDLGTFTFDIEEIAGDSNVVASVIFADIPVTKNSIITVDVQNTENIAPLQMDVDGDGTVDINITPGEGVSSQELTAILEGIIKTLNISEQKKVKLIKKIEKLEKILEKEFKNECRKKQRTNVAFENLTKKISQFQKKGTLTSDEATELLEIIGKIKANVIE